jgi:hypothetical protein
MKKSYCVFLEDKYYHDFIVLFNSWKYYENKIPIKVYVVGQLKEDRLKLIEKHCEVIHVNKESLLDSQFKGKYLFKWLGLIRHMCDFEILLDADTMFLSNIDYLFNHIEEGKLVVAREHVDICHKVYVDNKQDWQAEHSRIQHELRKYIGNVADNYTEDLITPTYNAGLFGLNKEKHSFLLEKSIEILTSDFDAKKNPISHLEQFNINLLIQLYDVEKHVLEQREWMNTWNLHKSPKKILKIESRKFALYNELDSKINFYHFTGGIGVHNKIDEREWPCRPHQLYETDNNLKFFTREDVENLWYKDKENPVLLLYEYFHNKGL